MCVYCVGRQGPGQGGVGLLHVRQGKHSDSLEHSIRQSYGADSTVASPLCLNSFHHLNTLPVTSPLCTLIPFLQSLK